MLIHVPLGNAVNRELSLETHYRCDLHTFNVTPTYSGNLVVGFEGNLYHVSNQGGSIPRELSSIGTRRTLNVMFVLPCKQRMAYLDR